VALNNSKESKHALASLPREHGVIQRGMQRAPNGNTCFSIIRSQFEHSQKQECSSLVPDSSNEYARLTAVAKPATQCHHFEFVQLDHNFDTSQEENNEKERRQI